jgi:hypothetical protein
LPRCATCPGTAHLSIMPGRCGVNLIVRRSSPTGTRRPQLRAYVSVAALPAHTSKDCRGLGRLYLTGATSAVCGSSHFTAIPVSAVTASERSSPHQRTIEGRVGGPRLARSWSSTRLSRRSVVMGAPGGGPALARLLMRYVASPLPGRGPFHSPKASAHPRSTMSQLTHTVERIQPAEWILPHTSLPGASMTHYSQRSRTTMLRVQW